MAAEKTAHWLLILGTSVLASCSSGGSGGSQSTPANTAPIAVDDSYSLSEGALLNTNSINGLLANDASRSGGALSVSILIPPSHGTLTLSPNGSFSYQHNGLETPQDQFVYQVTDTEGNQSTANARLSITTENDRPVASTACFAESSNNFNGQLPGSDEETPANLLSFYFDPQNPTATTTLSTRLGNTITLGAQGAFSYQATQTHSSGWDDFTYYVSDGTHVSSNSIRIILPQIRLMALGDSITRGVNSYDPFSTVQLPDIGNSLGYRADLQAKLRQDGINYDFVGSRQYGLSAGLSDYDPDTEGHPGATAEQLLNGCTLCIPPVSVSTEPPYSLVDLATTLSSHPADVILLHAGTNLVNGNANQSATALQNLVQGINSWAGQSSNRRVQIALASLIPSDLSAIAPGQSVSTINTTVSSLASQYDNVHLVPMHGALLPPPSADFDDALHPTAQGYGKMADTWYQALQASDQGLLQQYYRCE